MVISTDWEQSHHAAMDSLKLPLQLEFDNHAASFGVDAVNHDGLFCNIDGFVSPPSKRMSWVSALLVTTGSSDECSIDECPADIFWKSSISCWCTPNDDVPHLVTSLTVSNGQLSLFCDFLPRADGNYDHQCEEQGEAYPEPNSREAFAYAAVRSDFNDRYFTLGARAWRAGQLLSLGAKNIRTRSSASGPLHVHVELPLEAFEQAAALRAAAIERWLEWKQTARVLDHVHTSRIYARDVKLRAFHKSQVEDTMESLYGADLGQSLAAGDAGPEDMLKHSQLGQGSGGGLV